MRPTAPAAFRSSRFSTGLLRGTQRATSPSTSQRFCNACARGVDADDCEPMSCPTQLRHPPPTIILHDVTA
eukprot:3613407-Alexandrium_andersonii.AAC.1